MIDPCLQIISVIVKNYHQGFFLVALLVLVMSLRNANNASATKAASRVKVPAHKGNIVANVDFDNGDNVFDEEADESRVQCLIDSTIDVYTGDRVVG
jgi:hypothetical protein